MHFNKLDLNLLVALDALITECSVKRAAERLNLTPSATSNALSRLREYFGDDLLVQVGRRMELTPRAEGLRDAVRDVLTRIDSTIALQPEFVPSRSQRVFRLFASDYTQTVLMPGLLAHAAGAGSTARVEFLPQVANPQRELERGEADLLVIPRPFISPEHPSEVLYRERFVCVVWRDGPLAAGPLTAERYAQADHVVMEPMGGGEGRGGLLEARQARAAGIARRIAVTTYSFATLPALVVGTPFVATVHERLARAAVRGLPLSIHPLPFEQTTMDVMVQWHTYRESDPGLLWLRRTLHAAAAGMDRNPPDPGAPPGAHGPQH